MSEEPKPNIHNLLLWHFWYFWDPDLNPNFAALVCLLQNQTPGHAQQRLCSQTDFARNTQSGSVLLNLVIVALFRNSYLSKRHNPVIFPSLGSWGWLWCQTAEVGWKVICAC